MRAEHFVILGAGICVLPVAFGVLVNHWIAVWRRNGEKLWP